jgi:hypothetical protein
MPAGGRIHGVLVTFNRPASLADMVDELAGIGLASLTVVDNAPTPDSKEAAHRASATLPTAYLPQDENTGPAGGYAVGMTHVLETAGDDDWMLILDDDRLTGSGPTACELRDFGASLVGSGERIGAVGQMGARLDPIGRLRRLADDELVGSIAVDYIAGGQMLLIRVGAARAVGVFDAQLFFAFDDLEFCARLTAAGFGIRVYGPAAVRARERFGRMGSVAPVARRESPWRRYYSVRNHIVVMRRYRSWPAAVVVTVAHLFGRATLDLVRHPPDWRALIAATSRGCTDAWRGRLGRRVEPVESMAELGRRRRSERAPGLQ